jgi:hypothetical protein
MEQLHIASPVAHPQQDPAILEGQGGVAVNLGDAME